MRSIFFLFEHAYWTCIVDKIHELSMIGKEVNAVVIEFYFTNGSIKILIRVWAGDQTKKLRNRSSHFDILCKNNRRATVQAIFAY